MIAIVRGCSSALHVAAHLRSNTLRCGPSFSAASCKSPLRKNRLLSTKGFLVLCYALLYARVLSLLSAQGIEGVLQPRVVSRVCLAGYVGILPVLTVFRPASSALHASWASASACPTKPCRLALLAGTRPMQLPLCCLHVALVMGDSQVQSSLPKAETTPLLQMAGGGLQEPLCSCYAAARCEAETQLLYMVGMRLRFL